MRVPVFLVPAAEVFNSVRQILKGLPLPQYITAFLLQVVDVAFTTGWDLCLLVCLDLNVKHFELH